MPLRLRGEAGVWGGRSHPKFDSLYLPLADEHGRATIIVMAFTFDYAAYSRDTDLMGIGQYSTLR